MAMDRYVAKDDTDINKYLCDKFNDDVNVRKHNGESWQKLMCESETEPSYEDENDNPAEADQDLDVNKPSLEMLSVQDTAALQKIYDDLVLPDKMGVGRDYNDKEYTKNAGFEVFRAFRWHDKVTRDVFDAVRAKVSARHGVDPKDTLSTRCLSSPGQMGNPPLSFFDLSAEGVKANEVMLFHGTSPDTVPLIFKGGFNERWGQFGGLFGAGQYFAELASKADQYCTKVNKDKNLYTMVMARVLMGKQFGDLGRELNRDKVPARPKGAERLGAKATSKKMRKVQDTIAAYPSFKDSAFSSDNALSILGEGASTISSKTGFRNMDNSDGTEWVIYDGSQAFPEILIFFKRDEGNVPMLRESKSFQLKKKVKKVFGRDRFELMTLHFGPFHLEIRNKKGRISRKIEFHRLLEVSCQEQEITLTVVESMAKSGMTVDKTSKMAFRDSCSRNDCQSNGYRGYTRDFVQKLYNLLSAKTRNAAPTEYAINKFKDCGNLRPAPPAPPAPPLPESN
eukprot:g3994.t1